MTRSGTWPYMCECGNKHCGETLSLTITEWKRLSRMGRVVHVDCVRGRKVLEHYEQVCVLKANEGGAGW